MKVYSPLILLAVLSGAAATSNAVKSPVEKVVKLLEELQANLLTDAKVEQRIYDKYACWCENTGSAKAAQIMLFNSDVLKLTQRVLELKGKVAVIAKSIADVTGEIAANEEEQKDSTAVRQKGNGEWMTEKAELEEAINALERAIKVLGGAGTKSGLLQGGSAASETVRRQAVKSVLDSLPTKTKVELEGLDLIQRFAQEPQNADASYAPQSATVQGILKDMYDTFTSDLESLTQKEMDMQREYETLTHTLVDELAAMNTEVAKLEEEKAESEQDLADTVEELDATKKEMDATIEFFDRLKADCKAKHEEWEIRKAARTEELEGIKKALEILTSDEARELFANAIKPGMETSLLQLDSDSTQTRAANKAYDALKMQARKAHSLRLAALAAEIRSMGHGHFDAVIKKIDEMIQTLKDEEADDIKQRDWCKEEYHSNSEEKKNLKWLIKNNDAMITKLENKIQGLVEEITQTVNEIETTKAQIKQMEEERVSEHKEFQQAKSDDEAAIALLEKTKAVLSSFYEKNKIEMGPIQGSMKLLQGPEFEISADQAPDATFSDAGSRKNESKGIISIITMLIEDLKAEVSNGVKDEVAAQTEFEKSVKAAKKLIADLTAKKDDLEDDKAEQEEKQAAEEETKAENEKNLGINEDYMVGEKGIKPDCDWMLNSFEERREKRKAEMNGLVTAKEFLSGAAPAMTQLPAMLQVSSSFDDTKLEQIGFESLRR